MTIQIDSGVSYIYEGYCSGTGKSYTHRLILDNGKPNKNPHAGTPYANISWQGVLGFDVAAKNPLIPKVAKENAPWIIPSHYCGPDARQKATQGDHGQYDLLCFDFDKGNLSIEQLKTAFAKAISAGHQALFYTTSSSQPDAKKWRAMFPINMRLHGRHYTALLHCINEALIKQGIEPDRSLEQPQQLIYLPNGDEHYESHYIDGEVMELIPPDIQSATETYLMNLEKARAKQATHEKDPKPLMNPKTGKMSVQVAYNYQNTLEAELARYGCEERGDRWLPPRSETATAGINTMPSNQGPWDVCYCHNESETALAHRICDPAEVRIQYLIQHQFDEHGEPYDKDTAIKRLARETPAMDLQDYKYGVMQNMTVHEYNKAFDENAKQAALDEEVGGVDNVEAATAEEIKDEGWLDIPTAPIASVVERPEPVKKMSDSAFERLFPKTLSPFPYHNPKEQCAGFLGAFADGLTRLSPMNVANGGLLVSLPLFAAIVGDTVATKGLQTRTNLNVIALDESGAGKTALLNEVNSLCGIAGLAELVGPTDFASKSGVRQMLSIRNRPTVCYMDEIGRLFERASQGKGNPHAVDAINEITRIYSASNIYDMGTAQATKEPYPLDHPHLSILGVSTPEVFWEAFSSGNLKDGSIARYLAVPLGDGRPQHLPEAEALALRTGLSNHLSGFYDFVQTYMGTKETPYSMQWAEGVEDKRNRIIDTMLSAAECASRQSRAGVAPIIRRVAENAAKLALIQCMTRNYMQVTRDNEISHEDLDFGFSLAHWATLHMSQELARHGVGESVRGKTVQRILVAIQGCEERGKGAGYNVAGTHIAEGVFKSSFFKDLVKRDFDEYVGELQSAGKIKRVAAPTGGGYYLSTA